MEKIIFSKSQTSQFPIHNIKIYSRFRYNLNRFHFQFVGILFENPPQQIFMEIL